MSKKIAKKIAKDLDRDAIENVSSDLLADTIYSFATDLLKGLYLDNNIQDLDRAIETVNFITKDISSNGINLRKASIERRKKDKKDIDDPVADKDDVQWIKYNKRLEYTRDICINGKYPLKKRKEDVVVGLLTKGQLDDEDEDDGNYKLSSKEKEKLFSIGFIPDDE